MDTIKIRVNNKDYEYNSGTSLYDIAKAFEGEYKQRIIVATTDNRLSSLEKKINKSCTVNFYDVSSSIGKRTYIRGLYYLFSKAVKDVLNADVKIMYFMDKSVYCEILTNNLISEVTVEKIKIRMRDLASENIPINRIMVSRIEAINYFEKVNRLDKRDSLKYISNATISLYKFDNTLDYYYGILPCNSSYITSFNLKYLEKNKVVLMPPITFTNDEKFKYDKNGNILNEINLQSTYLDNIRINNSADLNKYISNNNYNNIIRVSETMQNNQLLNIANEIMQNKDIKLVLIDGPSSSGKTVSAKKLSSYLFSKGYDPVSISLYDYQKDVKDKEIDKKLMEEIDTRLFNKDISSLLNGEEVSLPKYDYFEGKKEYRARNKVRLTGKSIIVVEGIGAFDTKLTEMIPDKNKYKVFVHPTTPLNIDNHNLFKETDNRLLRKIIKDTKTKNLSVSEILKIWKEIRQKEEERIYPNMNEANVIFNTSLVYELSVLKTYAEPLLFSVSEKDENYDDVVRLINIFRVILGIPSEEVPEDSIIREYIGRSCFKDV